MTSDFPVDVGGPQQQLLTAQSCRCIGLFVKETEDYTRLPVRSECLNQSGRSGAGDDISIGIRIASQGVEITLFVGEFPQDQIHMAQACLMNGSADHVGMSRIAKTLLHRKEHESRSRPLRLKNVPPTGVRKEVSVARGGGD